MSSTLILCLVLNKTTIIARPIADSAAITVKIKKQILVLQYHSDSSKIIKLKLIDKNMSSSDISIINIFFLFKKIRKRNTKKYRAKKKIINIGIISYPHLLLIDDLLS